MITDDTYEPEGAGGCSAIHINEHTVMVLDPCVGVTYMKLAPKCRECPDINSCENQNVAIINFVSIN